MLIIRGVFEYQWMGDPEDPLPRLVFIDVELAHMCLLRMTKRMGSSAYTPLVREENQVATADEGSLQGIPTLQLLGGRDATSSQ